MKSHFDSLSPEQQKAVLAYRGDDTVGDAHDLLLSVALVALSRIADANPRNTNAGSAEQAFSWTHAVAASAIAAIEEARGK